MTQQPGDANEDDLVRWARIVTKAAWDEKEAERVKAAEAQAAKMIDREYGRVPEHPGDPLFQTLFGIAADIYEGKSH